MTDMEGTSNLHANEGVNNPLSDGSADADLRSTLDAINARLANLEGQQRALQSGKDKGIAGLQDEVNKIQTNFAEILEYGKRYSDPTEAERNYRIDQFLQTVTQTQAVPRANEEQRGMASPKDPSAEVNAGLLQAYGIDPQGPEYVAQIKAGKSAFEASLAVLANRKLVGNHGEGIASGVSGGAGSASPASGQERNQTLLKAQYDEALNKASADNGGYLTPRQLYLIQDEFVNKHGLDPSVLGW